MKDLEKRLLEAYNKESDPLVLSRSKYNRFDAENIKQIAELKVRHQHYVNTIIEFDKYAYNTTYSRLYGKEFLYIIGTKKGVFVFNITDLDFHSYDYKWDWRKMPYTTERRNNEVRIYIDKIMEQRTR